MRRLCGLLVLLAIALVAAGPTGAVERVRWWAPGAGGTLPAYATYADDFGEVGLLNAGGPIETKSHPFFEPIGANGRACVTCHQPANGMSVSVAAIQERWRATKGKDPIFAAIDGMNCPDQPPDDARSHSLLLERGLVRVFLPWPPRRDDGSAIEPEFTIEVVRDPAGCNTSPRFGLTSPSPTVSVYRRPIESRSGTAGVRHRSFRERPRPAPG